VDYLMNARNAIMLRYSHDGSHTIAPPSAEIVPSSDWQQNRNRSDQGLLSVTSTLSPSLINDFRFSFWYWSNLNLNISRPECTATCVGYGLPEIQFLGSPLAVGATENAPQGRFSRIWTYKDTLTWAKSGHAIRFGAEVTHENVAGYWDLADPAVITAYSPDQLNQLGLLGSYGLAGGIRTTADLLKLPVYSFITGVGDPTQPQPYDRSAARQNNRIHVFAADTWRARPNLTVSYGLAWSFESNLLNYDLPKPAFLDAILGTAGPSAGNGNYRKFSPSLGFAWKPGGGNTVIRAGAEIYYDTQLLWQRGEERSYFGPFPNGHVVVSGSSVANPIPAIPGAPVGDPINYTVGPTGFTVGTLMAILPPLRDALTQTFSVNGTNLASPTINVAKSAADLLPRYFPSSYSEQVSGGVQRQFARNLTVSSDFVFRQYMHTLFDDVNAPDYNHFNAAAGPVIPVCTAAQAVNPAAICSTGPITVWTPGGRGHYTGLLAKADRSLGALFAFTFSYALASQMGFDASNGFANLNNWFANYGPVGPRSSITATVIANLPFRFRFSLISTSSTRPPVAPYISGIDLSGSGTTYSLLPGASFDCFNRGCGKNDLIRLVNSFNTTLAGGLTPSGQVIPRLPVPSDFSLGNGIYSQDVRIGRTFALSEKGALNVFAEMFNVLNFANHAGFSFDLNSPGFGQPTQRVGQAFGSGGPRALQLGARLSF
jgi:hypothetical protein